MLALGRVAKRPRPFTHWLFRQSNSAAFSNCSSLALTATETEADAIHRTTSAHAPTPNESQAERSARAAALAVDHAKPELRLVSGCSLQAAPTKLNPLGEDAYFVSSDGRAIGVADGIGAWKQDNIDSGIYARNLMQNAKSYFESQAKCSDPKKAMQVAYQLTEKHGTCTACILSLKGKHLRAANLGDTGFLILRPQIKDEEASGGHSQGSGFDVEQLFSEGVSWKLSYKSFEMQYFFNCPVQVGTGTKHTPQNVAETMGLPVREGDLIITATDGVFDNLFINDIKALIAEASTSTRDRKGRKGDHVVTSWLKRLAKAITMNAIRTGLSSTLKTPFAIQARRAGFIHSGGKVDDSTVVVSLVTGVK